MTGGSPGTAGRPNGARILVTGFGFIGRHVAAELASCGCRVSVLERKPDLEAARQFGADPVLGDVRDADLLSYVVPEFDGVIHLAGLLGTSELVEDPVPAIETNLTGAVNVYQACRLAARRGRRIPCVQITAANYFMDNSYAITKQASERFASMFNREHSTDIRVVRAQNVYGEHQRNFPVQKIIPRFVGWALAGEPLRVYGDGSQVQDMIHAGDVARILVRTLFAPVNPGLVSAGTGRALTVLEIAREVVAAAGSASPIERVPMRAGEPEGTVVLGEPGTLAAVGVDPASLVTFEAGIRRTIDWYRANPGALRVA
jgi:nucleoside-diphosphate-sugar epimerase